MVSLMNLRLTNNLKEKFQFVIFLHELSGVIGSKRRKDLMASELVKEYSNSTEH